MRIPSIIAALFVVLFTTTSCSVTKKNASTKKNIVEIACADKAIPTPHFDWIKEEENVLKGYNVMPLPATYSAFSIDSEQLANFFTIAGSNMQGMNNLQILIPLPDPAGCQVFEINNANKTAQDNMNDRVALTGKDVDTKHNSLFMNYDGQKMTANVKWNGTDYKVLSATNKGKTYYIIFQKQGVDVKSQSIRQPPPANLKSPGFNR